MPASDGAAVLVVLVASVVCGRCEEWAVAWGVEVDGLEDVEVVDLRGALVLDGAGARTLVGLVVAVVRGQGCMVMVATLRMMAEESWCQAPPALTQATAALPYVPGTGGGKSGWRARRATGTSLWGRGIPLHVRWAAISPSGAPSVMPPLQRKKPPHSWPWARERSPWPIPRPPPASRRWPGGGW